jgi:hypothetical protein
MAGFFHESISAKKQYIPEFTPRSLARSLLSLSLSLSLSLIILTFIIYRNPAPAAWNVSGLFQGDRPAQKPPLSPGVEIYYREPVSNPAGFSKIP